MIVQPNNLKAVIFLVSFILTMFLVLNLVLPRVNNEKHSLVKNIMMTIISLLAIVFLYKLPYLTLIFYLVINILIYEFTMKFRGKWGVLSYGILGCGTIFTFSKITNFSQLTHTQNILFALGFSYMILKWVHFIMENTTTRASKVTRLEFYSYMLCFPCFVVGPILTIDEHQVEMNKNQNLQEHLDNILKGIKRVCIGLFKIYFLGMYTTKFTFFIQDPNYLMDATTWEHLFYMNMGLLDLFLNFSGLIDTAIGVGLLLNYNMPENFNRPYLARNFQDLWLRWHMTFSRWLRIYVFFPLYKLFSGKNSFKFRSINLAIALFITFYCMSVFEGFKLNYSIHGLILGIGAFISALWGEYIKASKIKGPYLKSKIILNLGRLMTWQYFAFAVLFFDAHNEEQLKLLNTLLTNTIFN